MWSNNLFFNGAGTFPSQELLRFEGPFIKIRNKISIVSFTNLPLQRGLLKYNSLHSLDKKKFCLLLENSEVMIYTQGLGISTKYSPQYHQSVFPLNFSEYELA